MLVIRAGIHNCLSNRQTGQGPDQTASLAFLACNHSILNFRTSNIEICTWINLNSEVGHSWKIFYDIPDLTGQVGEFVQNTFPAISTFSQAERKTVLIPNS